MPGYSDFAQSHNLAIPRDRVVFPSVCIPLLIKHPDMIRAAEHAFTTGRNIFVVPLYKTFTEDPALEGLLNTLLEDLPQVGTLCRIVQTKKHDDGALELLIEGYERALALQYVKSGEAIDALTMTDPLPEVADEQGEALVQKICQQIAELKWRVPNKFWDEPLIDTIQREGTDDPSNFADFVAFMLSLQNKISKEDEQTLLETFSVNRRLHLLDGILTFEVETKRLQWLLTKRVGRFLDNEFQKLMESAALQFIAERRNIHARGLANLLSSLLGRSVKSQEEQRAALLDPEIRKQINEVLADAETKKEIVERVNLTLNRRRNYVLQHLLEGVDVTIASLYLQARAQIKQEINLSEAPQYTPIERRRDRDADLKLFEGWASRNLGIADGRPLGRKNSPKPPDKVDADRKAREREIVKAMCEILQTGDDEEALTKRAVIRQLRRSPNTVYQWFKDGVDYEKQKHIAIFMYNDRRAFKKWRESGKGFGKLMKNALRLYEENFG